MTSLLNYISDSSERLSALLDQRMQSGVRQCFEDNKTSIEGFENCSKGIFKKAESATHKLEYYGVFARFRLNDCYKNSKNENECIDVARKLFGDIEQRVLNQS